VEPAHPPTYASRSPGVASQSSSIPGHRPMLCQCSVRPSRVVTVELAGSTATTLSRIQVQPFGITAAIGRSSDAIEASPAPT